MINEYINVTLEFEKKKKFQKIVTFSYYVSPALFLPFVKDSDLLSHDYETTCCKLFNSNLIKKKSLK